MLSHTEYNAYETTTLHLLECMLEELNEEYEYTSYLEVYINAKYTLLSCIRDRIYDISDAINALKRY